MNYFFATVFCCLLALTAASQEKKQWLSLNVAPKATFTGNYPTGYALYRGNKLGGAFDASFSYGRTIPKLSAFAELNIGYASYRMSVDERILEMYLAKNSLSYNFQYLQFTAKFGLVHYLHSSGISISPYVGLRYMFYLPFENISSEYHSVDISLFHSNDITSARYRTVQDGSAIHAFVLTGGVMINIPLNKRTNLTLAPFGDLGLTMLRMNLYESEQLYTHNDDVHNTDVVVSKGDALGLEIGLRYLLGHR